MSENLRHGGVPIPGTVALFARCGVLNGFDAMMQDGTIVPKGCMLFHRQRIISRMRNTLFLLVSVAIFPAIPAQAASFDCTQAYAADARAICASRVLSELDVEMAVRFETLAGLVAMGTRGDMGDAQKDFLASRHRCGGDARCLATLYRGRIKILKSQYDALKQRGPF